MFCDNTTVNDEAKSTESTLSSQKDNSLTMPSTSSNIITEEVQLLVNFIEKAATSYSEGNLENALHFYEQAIMIDPGNNVLFANKSAILLKLGRIKEAIEEASHSIQLKPEWPKVNTKKINNKIVVIKTTIFRHISEKLKHLKKPKNSKRQSSHIVKQLKQILKVSAF